MNFMEALKTVVEMANRYGSMCYESEDPERWGDEEDAKKHRDAFLAIERLSETEVEAYASDYTNQPSAWRTPDMEDEAWLYSEIDETENHEDENGVAWCSFTDFDRKWCCEHGLTEEITEHRALCELSAAFECRRRNTLEDSD